MPKVGAAWSLIGIVVWWPENSMVRKQRNRRQLVINRLSNNAGAVNPFFPHLCMHSEKSAISL